MGWSGYQLTIAVIVDAHAGEREERGDRKYVEFLEKLQALCDDPYFNDDSIMVTF